MASNYFRTTFPSPVENIVWVFNPRKQCQFRLRTRVHQIKDDRYLPIITLRLTIAQPKLASDFGPHCIKIPNSDPRKNLLLLSTLQLKTEWTYCKKKPKMRLIAGAMPTCAGTACRSTRLVARSTRTGAPLEAEQSTRCI